MRKYYLFLIKDIYVNSYYNKRNILYQTLKSLYEIKGYINYSLSVYNQICNIIDYHLLINYFNNKKNIIKRNNSFYIINDTENTYINISYSCIIIMTNNNFSSIFKILKLYSKSIFVCDFINNDYFWIEEYNHITTKDKYN